MIEIGADKGVSWVSLIDTVTLDYVNAATVTGSLQELDGTEIYTFTLEYEVASNGNYYGEIPSEETTDLVAEREYNIVLTAVSGQDVGKRVVREIAIDTNSLWVRADHPYFSSLSLSFAQQDIATMQIVAAQNAITRIIGRKIKEQLHDDVVLVSELGGVSLRHFPITYVERICDSKSEAIVIRHPSATNAAASVVKDGLRLAWVANGVRNTETILFADEPTLADLATAINAVSTWEATVQDGFENVASTDLVVGQFVGNGNSLSVWIDYQGTVQIDNAIGVVTCPQFCRRNEIRMVYGAGYCDVPEDLKKLTADLVRNTIDGKDGALASESLGDYSYSLASYTEQIKNLPINNQKILASYRSNFIR